MDASFENRNTEFILFIYHIRLHRVIANYEKEVTIFVYIYINITRGQLLGWIGLDYLSPYILGQ